MTMHSTFRRRADVSLARALATHSSVGQTSRRSLSERADVEATLDGFLQAGIPVSVCILAVDGLASYTENFGLEERHYMLARLRALVLCNVRAEDVLAEVGGGRFALLLPTTFATDAALVADRLLLACRLAAWNCAPVSLSLGVACAHPGCLSEERLRAAESAASVAMQAGGARVCVAG